jgi:hydrogenase-4 component E
MMGRRSLAALIGLYGLQNILLGFLALSLGGGHLVWVGLLVLVVKGFLIPWFLLGVLKRLRTRHEIESYLSVPLSMILGIVVVYLSFQAGAVFSLPGAKVPAAIPIAIGLILLGMLQVASRKTAVAQVLGFLALENGVFMLALAQTRGLPLFIELGVLLDAFAAVVLTGILIRRIKAEYGHVDTSKMRQLRG